MEKVSIVILTYNSAENISGVLESIKVQSYQNLEIIIVDNASQDATVMIAKQICPTAIIKENSENYWFAKGNNIGINLASGKYIFILNDDVVLHKECVAKLVERISVSPQIGAVTGKVYRLTDTKKTDIFDGVGLEKNIFRKYINIGENKKDLSQYNKDQQIFGVSGALFLVKRDALESIKFENEYFDEQFVAYKEDIDLSYRLNTSGWKIWYEPMAMAWHKRSVQKSSFKNRSLQNRVIKAMSYRNHWWVLMKNEFTLKTILDWPFILGYESIKLIYVLIFELNTFMYCLKSEPNNIKRILLKRKFIHDSKKI
ncbi:MAG: glycosyltransferase family 2 protein [Patescibacteria group bacterium]